MKNLSLVFPFDLRSSLDVKMNHASKRNTWTAYMNNAGTLCHVVCPDADILVRIKFYNPTKSLSPQAMTKAIYDRIHRYLVI